MYFPNIVSSELRRKRAAYYVARKFIDDYIGGVTLAKSIISIFGKQISKKEYVRIASTLQACEQKANTGASFVVDSITIFVTKETEQKYSSKQFEELFLNL